MLGVEKVGVHDNFFDLGGHSMLAIKLLLRIQKDIGVELGLQAVFKFAGLFSLAAQVRNAQFAQFDQQDLARMVEMGRDS